MGDPLEGARLKIARAREHLDAVTAAITIWLETEPNETRSKPAPIPPRQPAYLDNDTQVLPVFVPGDPPARLSILVGDCVTNARAALDHVVWQLALRYFAPAINPAETN